MTWMDEILAQYRAVGIEIEEDWSGAWMVAGDPPDACPLCGLALQEMERLDSGDGGMEILMGCEEHPAVWDTGRWEPIV